MKYITKFPSATRISSCICIDPLTRCTDGKMLLNHLVSAILLQDYSQLNSYNTLLKVISLIEILAFEYQSSVNPLFVNPPSLGLISVNQNFI